MIYVMSDIHGEYEKYEAMLKQIHFSDQDTLYVLGDVIDRGRDGLKTMLDMMQRPNVIALIGNHEWMAARCLPWLQREITEEFLQQLQEEQIQALSLWLNNGAMTTIAEFQRLSDPQRTAVLDYMMNLIPYAIVLADDRRYLLVHAGLGGFEPEKALTDYTLEELVWERPALSTRYFDDDRSWVIVGHTPTLSISGKAEICRGEQLIMIDCGAVYPDGRLACLCLDTMEVFYVG